MQAYVYGKKRVLPAGFEEFAEKEKTAIVSIDMHQGHLADTPDCPCPAPRARDIVEPINAFPDEARRIGVPIVHVRTVLRKGGVDDVKGLKAAWRLVFPLYVGDIANADAHALQGSRWTEFVTRVGSRDLIVETKKRLSVFYPTDLDFLLRNMGVHGYPERRLHRLLRAQRGLRCEQPQLSRGRSDLVRGTNDEMEDAALKMVSLHLGLVMDSADLLNAWQVSEEGSSRRRCR